MAKFVLSGFADEISPQLDEQFASLAKLDIQYMEPRVLDGRNIMEYTPAEAEGLRRRFEAAGVGISALGSPAGKIDIRDDFEPHLQSFCRMLETAKVLGAKAIRMFSFFIPETDDPANWRGEVMRRLTAFAKAAQGAGIMLLHENEKHIYGDIPERCLDILKEMDGAMLATYDPSNFVQCGVDNVEAFEMLRPYIRYMHLKDSVYTDGRKARDMGFQGVSDAHRPVGDGDGKVGWVLKQLAKDGFEGFCSIEPHLVNCELVPGTSYDKFAAAAAAARKLIAEAQE